MDIGITFVTPGRYVGKTEHHWMTGINTVLLHVTTHIAWAVSLCVTTNTTILLLESLQIHREKTMINTIS